MKAKIVAIVGEQQYGDGKTLYKVLANDKVYVCFSKRIKELVGKEVEFTEESKEYKGETQWTMNLPKDTQGGFQKGGFGGGFKGKTPEEIETTKRTMLMAYAKDVTVALINSGAIKDVVKAREETVSTYLSMVDNFGAPAQKTIPEPF